MSLLTGLSLSLSLSITTKHLYVEKGHMHTIFNAEDIITPCMNRQNTVNFINAPVRNGISGSICMYRFKKCLERENK